MPAAGSETQFNHEDFRLPVHATVPSGLEAADRSASAWALFLDLDGTLVEIADRPDAIAIAAGLPETMAALRDRLGGALAVITGRPIEAIDRLLAPHCFDVAGLHGAEQRLAGRISRTLPNDGQRLREAVAELRRRLADRSGVLVEDKGHSVAVHWRLAPGRADEALDAVCSAAARLGGAYRVQRGKAVAELVPASASKGRVIAGFLAAAPYHGRRPIFAGDDLTDETGFETVNHMGGLSIKVGPGATHARSVVESPAALRACLARWAGGGPIGIDA
jgi:trehalose 6-phosphate phosphatase